MSKVWTNLSKLTVHTASQKGKNLSGCYWIKVNINKIFEWNNIYWTFSVWNNYNVISKWSRLSVVLHLKRCKCTVTQYLSFPCFPSFIVTSASFNLVIVLFGFENQPASQEFIQLVTVLCCSPVDWWSSQNTQSTQTLWMLRWKYFLFLDKGVISSSTCISHFM